MHLIFTTFCQSVPNLTKSSYVELTLTKVEREYSMANLFCQTEIPRGAGVNQSEQLTTSIDSRSNYDTE